MTREETKKIIGIIMGTYPNWKPDDIAFTLDAWQMILEEFTYQQISLALKSYVMSDVSGFAPTIGQLVDMVQKINTPEAPSELEAWSTVSRALRNGAYHAQEEFENLHPLVQKAIGSHSNLRAMAIDEGYNEMVAQSNFLRSYRTVVQRDKELQKMPSEVRLLIENTTQKLGIGEN